MSQQEERPPSPPSEKSRGLAGWTIEGGRERRGARFTAGDATDRRHHRSEQPALRGDPPGGTGGHGRQVITHRFPGSRGLAVRQAGGVVLLDDRVVLRRTARGEYIFPKGHLDPGEAPEQTALREVAEETGLEAEIVAPLGEVRFVYQGEEYRVLFFLMRAVRELPEWRDHLGRDVAVVSVGEVPGLLSFEDYRRLWSRAERLLQAKPDTS